jgi:hypothetical protein
MKIQYLKQMVISLGILVGIGDVLAEDSQLGDLAAGLHNSGMVINIDHKPNNLATTDFQFSHVPTPFKNNLAAQAVMSIVEGKPTDLSMPVSKLIQGDLPTGADQPSHNFVFQNGTNGGRIEIDLGNNVVIHRICTYSWHPGDRAPQLYAVYGSGGMGDSENSPPGGADPAKAGWEFITKVDTRPRNPLNIGGQYVVKIERENGEIGAYRYLLFVISP